MSPPEGRMDTPLQRHFFRFILLMTVTFAPAVHGQITLPFARERQAFNQLEEKNWRKARLLLHQVLEKDSVSVEAHLGLALYFFNSANPRYNLDSARQQADLTRELLMKAPAEKKEKLLKFPIDSAMVSALNQEIEEETFRLTRQTDSFLSYEHFLKLYPISNHLPTVIRARDSIAYATTSARNNSGAFLQFLNTYPNSVWVKDAREKYDRLIFEETTRPGTTASYEQFLAANPSSPWRAEALERIFRDRTLDGSKESFQKFATTYPGNKWADRAHSINRQRSVSMGTGRFIPFIENKKVGFIGIEGQMLVTPSYDSLPYEIRCSPLDTSILLTPKGGYDRKGKLIQPGTFNNVAYLGGGFFITTQKSKGQTINRIRQLEGWEPVSGTIENAFLIDGRFLAVRREKLWAAYALNGTEVLQPVYDSMALLPSRSTDGRNTVGLLLLRRGPRFYLLKPSDLLAFSRGEASFRIADEVSAFSNGNLLIRTGNLLEMIDPTLRTIILPARQEVRLTEAGFIVVKEGRIFLQDWPSLRQQSFDQLEFRAPWMRTLNRNTWQLFHMPDQQSVVQASDSIWFQGNLAFARTRDSVILFTPQRRQVTIGLSDQVRLLIAQDSSIYMLVRNKTRLALYEANSARRIVQGAYSEIIPINRKYFMVRLRNKWGLVNQSGKEVLPADYDAMVFQNGWFSLLREGRFGGYHPETNRFLKATFDANLVVFSDNLMMARKNTKWGFLSPAANPDKVVYEFDEVRPLGDSLALTRQGNIWTIIEAYTRKSVQHNISEWTNADRQDRILFRSGDFYGILRLDGNILIQPKYQELNWISDDQHTLFIGFIPDGKGRFKVEYINELGIKVRQTTVDEEQLDLLLCDD